MLAGVAAGVLVVMFVADERNRMVFLEPMGSIQAGEKFGVSIGMPRGEARAHLERSGFTFSSTDTAARGQSCGRVLLAPGKAMDLYRDFSWRSGGICVVYREGKVETLGWSFTPLAM